MEIRSATLADTSLLNRWTCQLQEEQGRSPSLDELLAILQRQTLLHDSDCRLYIFRDAEGDLGYALVREEGEELVLQPFFIAPERRRRGHGRTAFNLLRKQLPRNRKLTVTVMSRNTGGMCFWKRIGFADYAVNLQIQPTLPCAA
ncbi:GNAT family N-acetyltransferase [Crenobacter sp. SG2305]|uniref:GNAT family N-acetyltransferase n=1 Tax=Crenobacter oryzisoli TaxID=3056844 RepID=UPI0025AAA1CE|nr:GNAT family N-acetyltransferase [Crenobacter sp. SG2305]MDN0084876.1 GNAT family N-acetyltransferase [Crenobacter sp. SG2305]